MPQPPTAQPAYSHQSQSPAMTVPIVPTRKRSHPTQCMIPSQLTPGSRSAVSMQGANPPTRTDSLDSRQQIAAIPASRFTQGVNLNSAAMPTPSEQLSQQ